MTLISYFRGAQGAILVYDVCSRESFRHLDRSYTLPSNLNIFEVFPLNFRWISELDTFSNKKDIIKMLVGNKIDQEANRVVTRDEGDRYARKHSMLFIEASARTRQGVQTAFEELVKKVLTSVILPSI